MRRGSRGDWSAAGCATRTVSERQAALQESCAQEQQQSTASINPFSIAGAVLRELLQFPPHHSGVSRLCASSASLPPQHLCHLSVSATSRSPRAVPTPTGASTSIWSLDIVHRTHPAPAAAAVLTPLAA